MKLPLLAGGLLALSACAGLPDFSSKEVRCHTYRDLIKESEERGLAEVPLPGYGVYPLAKAKAHVEIECAEFPAGGPST